MSIEREPQRLKSEFPFEVTDSKKISRYNDYRPKLLDSYRLATITPETEDMQNMRRNRIIGIMVVAFASILVVPALLSHTDEDLSKLTITSIKTNPKNAKELAVNHNPSITGPTSLPLPTPSFATSDTKRNTDDKPVFELASLDGENMSPSANGQLDQPSKTQVTNLKTDSKNVTTLPKTVAKQTHSNTIKTTAKSSATISTSTESKLASNAAKLKSSTSKRPRTAQTVQVASLTEKSNAEKLLKTLQKNNIPSYIKQVIVDKKHYTRVMIGPFNNEEALKQAQIKLSKLGY